MDDDKNDKKIRTYSAERVGMQQWLGTTNNAGM
jgi:hypothetical protein